MDFDPLDAVIIQRAGTAASGQLDGRWMDWKGYTAGFSVDFTPIRAVEHQSTMP